MQENLILKNTDELEPHPKNEEIYVNDDIYGLVESIEENGFEDYEPLIVTPNNKILAGHRRWKAAKELGIEEVPVRTENPESKEEELRILLISNEYRQKTPAEIVNEGEAWEEIERKKAKERNQETGGASPEKLPDTDTGDTRDKVGEKIGVSGRTYEKGKKVKETAKDESVDEEVQEEAKKQWEKMESGEQSIHGAYEEVNDTENKIKNKEEKEKKRKRLEEEFGSEDNPIQVYNGDFSNLTIDFDEKFDHVVTDPPYGESDIGLWSELSKFAYENLKDGGFLITYSGKYHLPEVIERLGENLEFYWQNILIHKGPGARVHQRNIRTGYKPILIFSKGEAEVQENLSSDVIQGGGREKDSHEWQQSLDEMETLLESFTDVNDRIIDPMSGSGTTLVACQNTSRRGVGIEKEEESYLTILERLEGV